MSPGPEPRPGAPPAAESAAAYLPLVQRVARALGRRLPAHIAHDDLVSAGVVGLLDAMQRFDGRRGSEFAAYAECRVRGAILDELRRGDLMARDARAEVKRLEACLAALTHTLGRAPEEEEVAAALHLGVGDLRAKLQGLVQVRVCSFEEAGEAALLGGHDPGEAAERHEALARLREALTRLTPRQQQVMHLYYREELTLKEIGVVLEVSESRVCQVMAAATLQLRALLTGGAAAPTAPRRRGEPRG